MEETVRRAEIARIAVITGTAKGIGRRVAETFAEEGYNLALVDLREPVETLKAATAAGPEAILLVGDISDEATVAASWEPLRLRHR